MVTEKTLKFFDFNNMEDYYTYILESKLNGQHQQAREFFQELEGKQQSDFWDWLYTNIDDMPETITGFGNAIERMQGMKEYFNTK